jgi:hypothetical protein
VKSLVATQQQPVFINLLVLAGFSERCVGVAQYFPSVWGFHLECPESQSVLRCTHPSEVNHEKLEQIGSFAGFLCFGKLGFCPSH